MSQNHQSIKPLNQIPSSEFPSVHLSMKEKNVTSSLNTYVQTSRTSWEVDCSGKKKVVEIAESFW